MSLCQSFSNCFSLLYLRSQTLSPSRALERTPPSLPQSLTLLSPLATSTQWDHMYSLRPACAVAFNYERCQLTQKAPSFLSGLRISSRARLFHGTLSCTEGEKKKQKKKHLLWWNNQKRNPLKIWNIHWAADVFSLTMHGNVCLTSLCIQWLNQKYPFKLINTELRFWKGHWFVSAKNEWLLALACPCVYSCKFACTHAHNKLFGSPHTSCLL